VRHGFEVELDGVVIDGSFRILDGMKGFIMAEKFETWGLVEVMGHGRFAGQISEQAIGGCAFVRVDVPAVGKEQAFTKLLGQAAIFAITPTSEGVARQLAASFSVQPVNVWELRAPTLRYLKEEDCEDSLIDGEFGGSEFP